MPILVADDDPVSRRIVQRKLEDWGYTVRVCADGAVAWDLLCRVDAPSLVILDWVMPHIDGLELCHKLRAMATPLPTYIILVTAKGKSGDIVTGLDAGADDYITKPCKHEDLRARLQVGVRVIELQWRLAERVHELENALTRVKQLCASYRFAPIARKFAMTKIIGNKSRATWPSTPRRNFQYRTHL